MIALKLFILFFVLNVWLILSNMLVRFITFKIPSSFDIYCTLYDEYKWFLTFWVLLTIKIFIPLPYLLD